MSHDSPSSDRKYVSGQLKRNNDFQEKFKDKISVTNKDGSATKYTESNYTRFASTNKIIGHRAKSSSSFFTENHRTQTEISKPPPPIEQPSPSKFNTSLKYNQTPAHCETLSIRTSFASSKEDDIYEDNNYENEQTSSSHAQYSSHQQEPPKKKPIITASELKRLVEDSKQGVYVPSLYEKKTTSPSSWPNGLNSKVFNPVNRILHLQEPEHVNSSRSEQGHTAQKLNNDEFFVHKSETSPSTPMKAQHNFPRFLMQNNLTPSRNTNDATANAERRVQGGYAEAHSNSSSYRSHIRKFAQEAEAKLKQLPEAEKQQPKQPTDSFYFSKKPREVTNFKPYTINDYKNEFISNSGFYAMKSLGPDLQSEELLEKQKKREKMLQYAQCVKDFNTDQISRDVFVPAAQSQTKEVNKPREKSARERALEFAKSNIPKPIARRASPKVSSKKSIGEDEEDYEEPPPMSALEMMELKNQQDREWIKNEFGLM